MLSWEVAGTEVDRRHGVLNPRMSWTGGTWSTLDCANDLRGLEHRSKPGSHTIEKVNHAPARKVAAPPPHQSWRKLLRILDRLGCFSFLSALASIWNGP